MFQDWADAYKHVHVRQEDIPLQVVEWGGMYFVDRSLTFGMSSSPGIYHRVSSVVKMTALARESLHKKNTFQVLDDCGYLGRRQDTVAFFKSYNEVGAAVKVRMAPQGDPDKSFECETAGTILGVHYDTVDWSWSFCRRKIDKILVGLHDVASSDTVDQKLLESISGKLEHYKHIVSEYARWERGHFLYLAKNTTKQLPGRWRKGPLAIKVTKELKEQAEWWIAALGVALRERTRIPDVRPWFPSSFLQLFPDAAGGSDTSVGNGFGGVIWNLPGRPMVYGGWPKHIQCNMKNGQGDKFARKLTMLEGVAALAILCARPREVSGKACKIYTDNKGLALAFSSAHSRDKYTYSVMLAIKDVAKYLNINLALVWTPRCSSPGELTADQLSKAKFVEAGETAGVQVNLCRVPCTLLRWLECPVVTRCLGLAILEEIREEGTQVLDMEPENRTEIAALKYSKNRSVASWKKVSLD